MNKRFFAVQVAMFLSAAILITLFALIKDGARVFQSVLAAPSDVITPTITMVDPTTTYNDIDTPIVITGTNFTAELSGTQVLTSPIAYLGSTVLENVTWVNSTTLTATVPWGLAPGVYTITIINPDSQSSVLPNAFTVTQGIGVWATGGPYGGQVRQIIVHPMTPTTIYAVVPFVGAFATFDGAEHWESMLSDRSLTRLAFDSQDPDVIYSGGSWQLQRTVDGGITWEMLPEVFVPANGCNLAYPAPHPTSPGEVYVGIGSCEGIPLEPGEGGVFYSDDYGNTWMTRTVGLTDTDLVDLAFFPGAPGTMAAVTLSGNVFTTTDAGLTWHWAIDLDQQLRRIYFNPDGAHEAWVVPYAEYQPPSAPYLYKSTDPGLSTWNTITVTEDLISTGGIWSLAFRSGTTWAAGERGYASDNDGITWTPVMANPNAINTIQVFAIPPDDDQMIYVGSEMDGVNLSVDGGTTWQERNEGLAGLQVRGLAVPRGQINTIYANTFERGILRSDDGGQTWLELVFFHGGSTKGQVLAADPFAPERVYFADSCDDQPCMQVSPDRGATWQAMTMTLPYTWDGWVGRTLATAPHPGVPGRILAGVGFCLDTAQCNTGDEPSGIYASNDYGRNWSFFGPTSAISEVLSFAFDTVDPNLIYAGTRGMGLWRSLDGGDTWAATPIPGMLPPVVIADIATHPDIAGRVYVRLYSYAGGPNPQPNLFVSDDEGAIWQELPDVDTVFGGMGGRGLIFVPPAPDAAPYALYSGCQAGLCRSPDGGLTWEQVEGAPGPSTAHLFSTPIVANSDSRRARLYIGTAGGIASAVGRVSTPGETIPGLGQILGGGVYRFTTVSDERIYLPLVLKMP